LRLIKTTIGVTAALCLGMAAFVFAQDQPPPDNGQAPAAATAGRGGGRGGRGGGRGPARGPDFPQQTRQLASPEVIARGKAVFGVNCTACHGADLRGGDMGGPNLLRSQLALSDQHGELIAPIVHGARQDRGMPAFNLSDDDVTAVAEYIHSMLAQVGRQGRPPGADTIPVLQVIVGNAVAGKTYFDAHCSNCHSVTGDLAGIGAKHSDGRELQNLWVGGGSAGGRGGFGAAAPDPNAKPTTVVVTLANGQKIQGNLLQQNEFVVTLVEQDGTRRSIARNSDVKSVEVHAPDDAHKKLVLELADKDMHDVTAYLVTVK
jgi:cytochrome c oxidase cbb3-type subunit III